jgi:hypothetical protein
MTCEINLQNSSSMKTSTNKGRFSTSDPLERLDLTKTLTLWDKLGFSIPLLEQDSLKTSWGDK